MTKLDKNFLKLLEILMWDFWEDGLFLTPIDDVCQSYADEYSTKYKGHRILCLSHGGLGEANLSKLLLEGMSIRVLFDLYDDSTSFGVCDLDYVDFI